jgi:hypothetical protein
MTANTNYKNPSYWPFMMALYYLVLEVIPMLVICRTIDYGHVVEKTGSFLTLSVDASSYQPTYVPMLAEEDHSN